jgi:hypothetical protein
MTPDPILNKLARFTPSSSAANNAALLFAAGRASARTPWVWKAAVAGLLLANLGWLSLLMLRLNTETKPEPLPQSDPEPFIKPLSDSVPPPTISLPPPSDDPLSYRALMSAGDPELLVHVEPINGLIENDKPLTPRTANRGEID